MSLRLYEPLCPSFDWSVFHDFLEGEFFDPLGVDVPHIGKYSHIGSKNFVGVKFFTRA